ncbi:MAG: hypothetical protein WC631_01210 [Candidatus Paceibacterota bacterium]|jgi:hypothetical protein
MAYFSRRNEYVVEYSGHEDVSKSLRDRLLVIVEKFVGGNVSLGNDNQWSIEPDDFTYKTHQEFPNKNPLDIIQTGKFHEVFTVVEIFLDLSKELYYTRRPQVIVETYKAFNLSGSVYEINKEGRVVLIVDKDSAEKIDSTKSILAPYPEFCDRFFQAVGNLMGRKSKPEDIVKDIFVAAEGYMKANSGASRFGDAIKEFEKQDKIHKEQKKVLEALNQFASDASGARHAGNSATPTERDALWFLDTLVAQLRMIDRNK